MFIYVQKQKTEDKKCSDPDHIQPWQPWPDG